MLRLYRVNILIEERVGMSLYHHCHFIYGQSYKKTSFLKVCLLSALCVYVCSTSYAASLEVTGAGSSFAAPVYQAWSVPVSREEAIEVNYQTIGSSAGQDQVIAGTVDFGASDKPMDPQKLEKTKLYQFPTVVSGVVVVVNIKGIPSGKLHLDGASLAELYDGTITRWNDPKIKALNPDLDLPDEEVASVHRADGSGTTYVFTSYLSQMSLQWRHKIGAGTLVGWCDGAGARGNDGVAALVKQTEGSIGYVEYAFAMQNHMNIAQLKNHDGFYVGPTLEGFKAATEAADWNNQHHYVVNLLDQAGRASWPIVTATYVLALPLEVGKEETQAVYHFFQWGFKKGESYNQALGYVSIPDAVKSDIMKNWPHR